MEFWYIIIWDGYNEIDRHFIDISYSAQYMIDYCLKTFYGKNSPYEIFKDVVKDETMNINKEDEKENYDIYCTNHIPDISIEKRKIIKI